MATQAAAPSAQANYETGFFSTPGDLLTAANEVNDAINNVDNAIDGKDSIPQDWWDGFTSFMSSWKAFYSSKFGSGSSTPILAWLTSDLEAQLVAFQQQTATWQTQADGFEGVTVPGPVIQPADNSIPSIPGLPSSTTVIVVLVLLVAIVLGSKL